MKKKYISPEIEFDSLNLCKDVLAASTYTEEKEVPTTGGNDEFDGF